MRNHAIDGLRALAMTMVVAQHCGLLPFGWTGVWLFYVISGYVITQGFVSGAYCKSSFGTSYRCFMWRRATRIVPVYLLYIGACLLVAAAIEDPAILLDLPYLLTFTFNWQMIFGFWPGLGNFGPLGHLWTLSVEQQFYLVFGLFALLLPSRAQIAVGLCAILAGPFVRWGWSSALASTLTDDHGRHAFSVYAATHCHADAFLMGSLIARLEPELRARSRAVTRWSWAALFGAAAYALTYVVVNRALGVTGSSMLRNVFSGVLYGQHREVFAYVAVDAVAAAVLLRVLVGGSGTRWLELRPLAWVGRVSYGGYLFHALVIWCVHEFAVPMSFKSLPLHERILVFLTVWFVTVAVASASYQWFELPLARRLSGRQKAAPRVAPGPVVDSYPSESSVTSVRASFGQ